jgi:hypothetical protein
MTGIFNFVGRAEFWRAVFFAGMRAGPDDRFFLFARLN